MTVLFPQNPFPFESSTTTQHDRQLGGSNDENNLLVDPETGESYPPYSLSWRYLGLYIDCSSDNNDHRRRLDGNNNACTRKVLWAAYHDAGYRGGSIGEYSFFNRHDGTWDGSTCRAQYWWPFTRCRRLNCHEAGTRLQLLGVYKQTDGLYDWSEQLFKHQGYCVWNEDQNENGSGDSGDDAETSDYQFMQNVLETWTSGCAQLDYADPSTGQALYLDTKPLPRGDMTYGVYTDASCMTESTSITWTGYLENYGGDDDDNAQYSSSSWTDSVDRWNDLLGDYKVCQPCRAYSRVREVSEGSHDSGSGDQEDGDDGEGGSERWGFNCYDAAGYKNCNQCYKFQTQTDLEIASVEDLEEATNQGTILAVKIDGKRYGQGYFHAPGHVARAAKQTSIVLASSVALIGLAYLYFKFVWSRRASGSELKEALTVASKEDDDTYFKRKNKRKSKFRSSSPKQDPPRTISCTPLEKENPEDDGLNGVDTLAAKKEAELLAKIEERDMKLSEKDVVISRLQLQLDQYKAIAEVAMGGKIIEKRDQN